jgi:hypothetical protein
MSAADVEILLATEVQSKTEGKVEGRAESGASDVAEGQRSINSYLVY